MHTYQAQLNWTGNTGLGTANYRAYTRDYELRFDGKAAILEGSSDPLFRGDPARYNPEELLLGSLSACHMLWYLHLCAEAGVVVVAYEDAPEGKMQIDVDGGGRFVEVTLRPMVTVAEGSDEALAESLHTTANARCFIANSCNFPVRHEGRVVV